MSFTSDIKQEIAFNELKDCCSKSELSALIQLCSSLTIANRQLKLVIKTENATTAKRIWKMLKDAYGVETQLSVIKKMNLKKNNIYEIQVLNKSKEILEDLGIYSKNGLHDHPPMSFLKKDCCLRAYLAGAFMAIGSCNAPNKSNYHLELATTKEAYAKFINNLMHKYHLPSKVVKRRNKYVVYLKAADKIADFLRCVGAHESLMNFENIRIERDFMNSITRLDNCELANEMKSIKAAKGQLEDIQVIETLGDINVIDEKLKIIIKLRKEYPEYSLVELSKEYEIITGSEISKSGLRHRLNKINDLANKLRKGE